MSLSYKFIVFDDNVSLFVNMDTVTYAVDQDDEKGKNIRGTFPDIPELDGHQCSLKTDDVGLYALGTLWWSEQGAFAYDGQIRDKLIIRCLYPDRLDDIPRLYKYLDHEVSEEDRERFEAEDEQRKEDWEIQRIALEASGDDLFSGLLLDDFRNYGIVNNDRKMIDEIEIETSDVDEFLSRAEYPTDYAERLGPKWSIESQEKDVIVVPLTRKNIRLAGDLLASSIVQYLEREPNKGRYCLVVAFRHLHDGPFHRKRVCTTLLLLESKRLDHDRLAEYAKKSFGDTPEAMEWACNFLKETGQYKAYFLMYGKSHHRFKTNSLTLSPVRLTFPVITGKRVWIVEGQNDGLALYHWLKRRGSTDIVMNVGTATLGVFDRTDLPAFCPASTEVVMFLDNLNLNVEAAKLLYIQRGYRKITLAQDHVPSLADAGRVETIAEQYAKAQKFADRFTGLDLSSYRQQEESGDLDNRKSVDIGNITLGDIPGLTKKPGPVDFDADDFVALQEKLT